MSLAIVYSRAQVGVNAPLVTVEAHLSNGLPAFSIVGLPEAAVKESKERVRSALINAHFDFPARRITINLAPADLPKEGGRFDLPIALAILAASEQLPTDRLNEFEFVGELALSGSLRGIKSVLPAAVAAIKNHRQLIVPNDNALEASLANDGTVLSADHLLPLCAYLRNEQVELKQQLTIEGSALKTPDLSEVKGQSIARRALEIAAAGRHNLLLYGTPGAGKTMLAKRLNGILPALSKTAAMELATVQSIAGQWSCSQWAQAPFRNPHHSASAAALVGGGSKPSPGEISLAHHGVLFLDELPEFQRQVLEVMREPMESGQISIARVKHKLTYPADFQLIAAMNPCPCGYLSDPQRGCRCSPAQIQQYRSKLSGPLLDRIDMHVHVLPISSEQVFSEKKEESSAEVKVRVLKARKKQLQRGCLNQNVDIETLYALCELDTQGRQQLHETFTQLQISARAMTRVLRVARTIADLADAPKISQMHIAEAISYRNLDRPI